MDDREPANGAGLSVFEVRWEWMLTGVATQGYLFKHILHGVDDYIRWIWEVSGGK